jgi:hypothetical protein
MDNAKRKVIRILLLIYLIIFPFGQFLRYETNILGVDLVVHPIDLVALITVLVSFLSGFHFPKVFKYFAGFILTGLFSYLTYFAIQGNIPPVGLFYLFRLLLYILFFASVWNQVKKDEKLKDYLYNGLIFISLAVSILGFIQYIFFPDLTTLYFLGWDDHLYRLVGSFLDPTFTGIILTFGFILCLVRVIEKKEKKYIPLAIIFLLSVALTFSRASYLALGITTIYYLLRKKIFKTLFLVLSSLVLIVWFLPKPAGEGVDLTRTKSISARLINYSQGITIWTKSPLLGVGFNNICFARKIILNVDQEGSHACSGLDSSLLLILATTGYLGMLQVLRITFKAKGFVTDDYFGKAFKMVLLALFIHSFFSNSFFYAWIMGLLAILLALSYQED